MNRQSKRYLIIRTICERIFSNLSLSKWLELHLKIILNIILVFFPLYTCFAQDKKIIDISRVKIYQSDLVKIPGGLDRFEIEIDINNGSNNVLFFWSMHRTWERNFIIKGLNVGFYVHCIGDAPKCDILLPGITRKYKGVIYCKSIVEEQSFKNISIGFKYYNALKINERTYLKDFFDQSLKGTERSSFCGSDTIWYRKPILLRHQFNNWLISN